MKGDNVKSYKNMHLTKKDTVVCGEGRRLLLTNDELWA